MSACRLEDSRAVGATCIRALCKPEPESDSLKLSYNGKLASGIILPCVRCLITMYLLNIVGCPVWTCGQRRQLNRPTPNQWYAACKPRPEFTPLIATSDWLPKNPSEFLQNGTRARR